MTKSRQRSLVAGQRVLVLLPDSNNNLLCNWKGPHTVFKKVNDTNYEIDLSTHQFIKTMEGKNG